MPDITMCDGGDCPKKAECYRATAKPNKFQQSYFVKPPFRLVLWTLGVDGEGKFACDRFIP